MSQLYNSKISKSMAQISGKVICILPVQSGENERGEWQRGGVVIETLESPSVKLALSTFGKRRTEQIQQLTLGEVIVVSYSPESREFMNKWYTELRLTEVLTTAKQATSNN